MSSENSLFMERTSRRRDRRRAAWWTFLRFAKMDVTPSCLASSPFSVTHGFYALRSCL